MDHPAFPLLPGVQGSGQTRTESEGLHSTAPRVATIYRGCYIGMTSTTQQNQGHISLKYGQSILSIILC